MVTSRARVAPWALTSAAVLMGVALLATVWATYRAVQRSSETVVRGQADVFREGARIHLAAFESELPQAALQALLDDYGADGVRYVALLEGDGALVAAAGTPSVSPDELARAARRASPSTLEEAGDRIRMVLRKPPPRRRGRARRGLRDRQMVLEFEPLAATELRASATRTLGLGALAAGGFLALAVGLVRYFLRRQAHEQQLERERRLAGLGQMSAVLAHEIRNPLASLKGNAQLLAAALPEGERTRAKADRVVAEAVRLEGLTQDLLEFARSGELHRAAIDPSALVSEVAATRDGARISIDHGAAPARWSLDGPRLSQVIGNLFDNALAAGDGQVEVAIGRADGRLTIAVRDHGPGLAEDELARVFEPFFTRKTRGTGLGLAVARRLVELHGGTLQAANAEGGGACFRLEIPAP